MKTNCANFSHRKALVSHFFPSVIWPLVRLLFGNIFSQNRGFSHAGSNDTGLMFVSRPAAEPIECQTDRQNMGNII